MSFFISEALADSATAGAQQAQAGGTSTLIFIAATFGIFYFLFIRPQNKRAKEHRKLLSSLSKGDEVLTNGGVLGKITAVDGSFISLEIAQGVEIKVQKPAISTSVPKGTYKS